MNGGEMVELRILDGLHAGARVPLPLGSRLVLGATADESVDIVLRDLPEGTSGTIEATSDKGWQWAPHSTGPGLAVSRRQCLRLGPVLMMVQARDAAWPGLEQFEIVDATALESQTAEAPPVPTESTERSAASGHDGRGESEGGGEHAESSHPSSAADGGVGGETPAPNPAPLAGRVRGMRGALGVSVAMVIGGSVVWLAAWLIAWATPPAPPPPPPPPRLAEADLRALLDELTIDARLVIVPPESDAPPGLEGVVGGEQDMERLTNALSRLPQRPALRVLTTEDFIAQAEMLTALHGEGIRARSPTVGTLELSGVGRDDASVAALRDRLSGSLPRGIVIEDHSFRADQVSNTVQALLEQRRLRGFELSWENGHLRLEGRLQEENVNAWEHAVLEIDRRFDGRVPFTAAVQLPPPGAYLRRHVSAVVSGNPPYVVLTSGQKVMPGGRVGNYRLMEIRDSMSVWEWSGGQQAFAIER